MKEKACGRLWWVRCIIFVTAEREKKEHCTSLNVCAYYREIVRYYLIFYTPGGYELLTAAMSI